MKVLVTGTEGYLGCLLAPELLRDGHEVVGVDTGFYKNGWLYNGLDAAPHTLAKDIRHLTADDLEGVDAVVHMAELSNDPLGQLSPTITYEINHQGSVRLARARQAGRRLSGSSTCPRAASTASPTARSTRRRRSTRRPRTPSARPWSSETCRPWPTTTSRRRSCATRRPSAPRRGMRFDIVLNNLSGLAWTTEEDRDDQRRHPLAPAGARSRHRPGDPARARGPARASCTTRSSTSAPASRTTACARSPRSSATSSPAARSPSATPAATTAATGCPSTRSPTSCPASSASGTPQRGAAQLHDVFRSIDLDDETFTGRGHTRLLQLAAPDRTPVRSTTNSSGATP